jgi:hypothetical protein
MVFMAASGIGSLSFEMIYVFTFLSLGRVLMLIAWRPVMLEKSLMILLMGLLRSLF